MQIPWIGTRFALFGLVMLSFFPGIAEADPCSLAENPFPRCFRARVTPTLKTILVHYGDHANRYDFEATRRLFVERFNAQMGGTVNLEIVDTAVIPLKTAERDLVEMEKHVGGNDPANKPRERLERLWYYYYSDAGKLVEEVNALLLESGHRAALEEADTVLVISEPQFEALGFATGGYGFTEQPSEIAWALSDGGRTEWQPSGRLVDELLHETGHLLGLDHASAKCFTGASTQADTRACCLKSPGKNDVMSYCRDRATVKDSFYYGYTSCTKKYVRKKTVPTLLDGGPRNFQETACD